MFLLIEFFLVVVSVALACVRPQFANWLFDRAEKLLAAFSQRRVWAVFSVGLLAVVARLALLLVLPIPVPEIHDEYSHLLLADTLAHGRLANPTHPMWVYFETFHVNWQPTYASMYYPGYALFLAFGQRVLGNPFWGVLLSSGLMCGAIVWALQGWIPPAWAVAGGLLAVIRIGTFSYWVDSYWGGTVTALGGALVLGALPRLKHDQKIRDAIVIAIGMGIIASTRPFEGLFFCAPILLSLIWWTLRRPAPLSRNLVRIVIPATLVTSVCLGALGYYFYKVTGSPFTIPYKLNMRTYGLVYFPWDKIRPVAEFHHAALQNFYRGGPVVGLYNLAREHPFRLQAMKALVIWLFYFGPVFTAPFLVWLFARPRWQFWKGWTSEFRFLVGLSVVTYLSLMVTIYIGQPHYASVLTAAFYAMILLVLRDLYYLPDKSGFSFRFLARCVPLICLILLCLRVAAPALHATPKPSWIRTWCSQDWQNYARAKVLKQLENTPGDHLVIVRYKPDHDFILNEWVFNNADIDGSKVIWARDMGAQNAELIRYFKNRQVWLAEPDYNPPKLTPYAE